MRLKKGIGKIVSLLKSTELVAVFFGDMVLFAKHSHRSPFADKKRSLYYRIISDAHAIEKGLTLHSPRIGFGRAKVLELRRMLSSYSGNASDCATVMGVGALKAYVEFCRKNGLDDEFVNATEEFVAERLANSDVEPCGGTRFLEFGRDATPLETRASYRRFSNYILTDDDVTRILSLAQRAPSQCNRQSARVHLYRDPALVQKLLEYQGGASGFSDRVTTLFILTSDLTAWGGPRQRNQAYVDGGIYSMAFMLACTQRGFMSCPLNLAVDNVKERSIKTFGAIPENERLVMMVAVGRATDEPVVVAKSFRMDVMDVLTIH